MWEIKVKEKFSDTNAFYCFSLFFHNQKKKFFIKDEKSAFEEFGYSAVIVCGSPK